MTFRQIIRLLDSDITGEKRVGEGLRKIKGISFMYSNAVCVVADIDPNMKSGDLSDEQIKRITDVVKNPLKNGIPEWLVNRRKDRDSGEDRHVTSTDLKFEKEFDIKYMKKIKSYKGVRHSYGLPVRGQRTRGNFRHGKTVGVKRKGVVSQKAGKKK